MSGGGGAPGSDPLREAVDTLLAHHCAGMPAATRSEFAALGARAVPRLLEHLAAGDDVRAAALEALRDAWDERALEPVAALLSDGNPDTRRAAARLLDRHRGRDELARRCADLVAHADAGVAGFCLQQAETRFPDVERMRAALTQPALRGRAGRSLARYYRADFAALTAQFLDDADVEVVRAGLAALLHQDDGSDPLRRARVRDLLGHADAWVRDAAAEYFAWHGRDEDRAALAAARAAEHDVHARAALDDALGCIARRGADEMAALAALRTNLPAHEPLWFYGGRRRDAADEAAFAAQCRLRAELLALPADVPLAAASPAPATRVYPPTRDCLLHDERSFGVRTDADDRAFGALVHVGDDIAWHLDHACVVSFADGIVRSVACEDSWGYKIVIEHELDAAAFPGLVARCHGFAATIDESLAGSGGGLRLCSLYAHLGHLPRVQVGQRVRGGQKIGVVGRAFTWENGGYPAHLHLGLHLGPYVQSPRVGSGVDINFKGKRHRGRAVGMRNGRVNAWIHHDGDPWFRVERYSDWQAGYVSAWYWDEGVHGWLGPRAFLRWLARERVS